MDKQDFDEGTHILEHLADEIAAERKAGASHYAVPEDEPGYVDDEDSIEPAEPEHDDGSDGPAFGTMRPA